MIAWYAIAVMAVGVIAALVCLFFGLRKRDPNDYTLGATLLGAVLLLVQIIISIVAPFAGNTASGDPLEYWMYLIVAFLLPLSGIFWALVDRSRWANFVLVVVNFAVAVMTYRMLVIWGG